MKMDYFLYGSIFTMCCLRPECLIVIGAILIVALLVGLVAVVV